MYDDAGLKKAIEKNIITGPRMIIATRAIVAKGTYGPKSENPELELIIGAEEVSGKESIANAVRSQIGKGADIIKVYADYRYGLNANAVPTFTEEELRLIVDITSSSGRKVVAHASSAEGMKRAVMAGVSTIEHGDNGNDEIFKLMKTRGGSALSYPGRR
jgi:imidazolonepropionase-like amidohydrolase